jgi:hypothetical protein
MISKSINLMTCFVLLVIIFYLSSCTPPKLTFPKDMDLTLTEPGDKIPLKAALFFNQEFKNAKYIIHQRQFLYNVMPVGDALCYSSEKIMKNIFQQVVILDTTDRPDSPVDKYDVIIAPEVVTLDYAVEGELFSSFADMLTVIKWNISSPEGKEIYSTTIKTSEEKIAKVRKIKTMEEAIKPSLKENFQKAQEDIYTNRWWQNQWWKEKK